MYHFTIEKIERLLEHTGLTRVDLATLLEIDKSYVTKMLNGNVAISRTIQIKLNEVFSSLTDEQRHIESVRQLKQILEGKDV